MLLNDAPLGTIEQGKIADLMLLDANPFEDISNTRKIRAVVVRGQMLDRETLDTLLVRAEKLAHKLGPSLTAVRGNSAGARWPGSRINMIE